MRLGSSVWCIRSERNGRPMSRRFSREVGLATTVKRTCVAHPAPDRPAQPTAQGHGRLGGEDVRRPYVHIVIRGCGRVGSTLAHTLESRGHSVAIIDQDEDAFRRLGPDFTGLTVTGIGYDREVLEAAGIER